MANQLIAGVDSSTQSVKIVIRAADTGELVREGRAPHPDGTEVDPIHWKNALDNAIAQAGGLADVSAISVGGQQHGMVALDNDGEVIRPALLWNDTRSAKEAEDLNREVGGDPVIGTTHIDCLKAFQDDPDTTAIVMIGEIGGDAEERAAAFIAEYVTKPVVGYVAGFTAPEGKTMGHAGAIVSGSSGTAQAKKDALEAAGVKVGQTPSETARLMRAILGR